jgi:hypothetical protein
LNQTEEGAGEVKFTFRFADPIKWPNKCVCCGGIATTSYTAYGSILSGYAFKIFWQEVKYRKMGLPYPVCRKHKYWAITVRTIYFLSFLSVLFGGIIFLAMLSGMSTFFGIWGSLIGYLFVVLIFIQSIRLHPVRLKEFGEHFYTFLIRNEDYAREFAFINDLGAKEGE